MFSIYFNPHYMAIILTLLTLIHTRIANIQMKKKKRFLIFFFFCCLHHLKSISCVMCVPIKDFICSTSKINGFAIFFARNHKLNCIICGFGYKFDLRQERRNKKKYLLNMQSSLIKKKRYKMLLSVFTWSRIAKSSGNKRSIF